MACWRLCHILADREVGVLLADWWLYTWVESDVPVCVYDFTLTETRRAILDQQLFRSVLIVLDHPRFLRRRHEFGRISFTLGSSGFRVHLHILCDFAAVDDRLIFRLAREVVSVPLHTDRAEVKFLVSGSSGIANSTSTAMRTT